MNNIKEEKIIRWFSMCLTKDITGAEDIFLEDIIYIENYSLKYEDLATIKYWFLDWNKSYEVVLWNITNFFT